MAAWAHFAAEPCSPLGLHLAGADVGEELGGRRGLGRLRPGTPDVDAGMVVGAADARAAVGVDVDGGRQVELAGAGAVADLPDREQLREAPAVACREGRADRVERMRQRAGDLVGMQVVGDDLDVAGVGLQPLVVGGGDAVTEHVHLLGLALEVGGQLLGEEHVGPIRDGQRARDRVVIGDRHEVHAPALGQLVDLLGQRGALGQAQRALHAELGHLGGRRVAVHVDPAGRGGAHRLCAPSRWHSYRRVDSCLQNADFCDRLDNAGVTLV